MVETQLCKLRNASDTFVGRAYSIFHLYCMMFGKMGGKCFDFCFFLHAAARGGTRAFTLTIVNTLIKNSSRND